MADTENLREARAQGMLDRSTGKPFRSPYTDERLAAAWRVGWTKGPPKTFDEADDGPEFAPGPGGVDIALYGGASATPERKAKGRVSRDVHLGPDGKRAIAERGSSTAPLDRCRNRKCITDGQWLAGRRFCSDWRRAGYNPSQITPMEERIQRGKFHEPGDRIDAQGVVRDAMQRIGQSHTAIALAFLIDEKSLGQIERAMKWPAASARVAVGLVLDALGEFYEEQDGGIDRAATVPVPGQGFGKGIRFRR